MIIVKKKKNSLFQIVAAVSAQSHRSVLAPFPLHRRDIIVQAVGLRFDVYRIELEHDAGPVGSDHVCPIVEVVIVIGRVIQRGDRTLVTGHGGVEIVIIRQIYPGTMRPRERVG